MVLRAVLRRKKTAVAVVVLAAVVVVGAVFALRSVGDELLAGYYVGLIDEASDPRGAEVLIRQAADLGEPGLRVLVAGLGSEEEAVARVAREMIAQRLEAWKSLRTRYSTPLLARLAHELADAADGFDAVARKDAARFAGQILDRRLDRHAVDRCGVISSCQKVMRIARPEIAARGAVAEVQPSPEQRLHADTDAGHLPIARLAALAGGGLPKSVDPILPAETLQEQMERIALIASMGDPQARASGPVEQNAGAQNAGEQNAAARWFNGPSVPRPIIDDRDAPSLFRPANVAARLSHDMSDLQAEADGLNPSDDDQSAPGPNAAVVTKGVLDVQLPRAKTVDLLRRLQSVSGRSASAVENELRCRGFKDHHFRIAARLFDPDPAARIAMARRLQGIPRLNPRPWLLVLAADPDADVRLTAITLLATASDPSILAEVESLARRDPDPRIQLQAKIIADRRARR